MSGAAPTVSAEFDSGVGGVDVDVLDLTVDAREMHEGDQEDGGGDQHAVRLQTPIDVSSLISSSGVDDGVIFEPEIDESWFKEKKEDRNYFMSASGAGAEEDKDKIDQILKRIHGDSDSDDQDADTEEFTWFERKTRKMKTLQDGIRKKVAKAGLTSAGCPPQRGTVTIHYSLFLDTSDDPFDSTLFRGRLQKHRLDAGQLLPGMELAVKSMEKKEESWFLIEPEYAFGDMGCPPRVPPKAEVLALIELRDFAQEAEAESLLALDPEARAKEKTYDDIERIARIEHVEGNGLVKSEDWRAAERRYGRGIRLLEESPLRNDEEESRQKRLLLKLRMNRAHCLIKLCWPKKACIELQKTIDMDEKNVKALYRMGKSKRMIGNHDEARRYLRRAQKLKPSDVDVGRELSLLDKQVSRDETNERELCRRMMSGATENTRPCEAVAAAAERSGFRQNGREQDAERGQDVDDDFYEDMNERLQALDTDSKEIELVLPQSFTPAEIRAVNVILSDGFRNLRLVEHLPNRRQFKIVKKSC